MKSGTKHYDWIGSARGAKALLMWQADFANQVKRESTAGHSRETVLVTGESFDELLKKHEASSATELLEKVRKDSKNEPE